MSVEASIREKLAAALTPQALEIEDQSDRHRGHAGWREGGATHFHIFIVSADFEGLASVARHRRIYQILEEELAAGVHALALTTRTPDEQARADTR